MSGSSDSQREEVEALWAATFGEAPAIRCNASLLAEVLVRNLPPAPPYGDPLAWRDREALPIVNAPDVTHLNRETK